ncbi:hypothetical protein [Blastochloris viridis]|uniref:Uncharacterized protein n=1 Tax=Blastochloris viridis TaxID=1079 RepID=A0A0H5BFN4_BLAVI|nr:hypothetical protein [Blastochloris viridis]ALK09110.1 hypothetical protein BVIR_1324 [Blastochloris viridis]BAS01026.1 hypothetical protein BV133_3432 [Blastochloris viridis]CUU41773.1 hypothetical protein BVIRIDIS_07690 [Blastochloris viridis]
MTEAPDNIMRVLLRRIDERTDRMAQDLHAVGAHIECRRELSDA